MTQGLFELQTPQDLLEKLQREYRRLEQAPLDQDVAFNLFITAEHIPDWLYPGDRGSVNAEIRSKLKKSNNYLVVCSDIANGSKHFKVNPDRHHSVSGTSIKGAFDSNAFDNKAFDVARLVIDLDGEAANQLGSSIDAIELAHEVLEFWKSYIADKASNNALKADAG
jgi:hypothetical protein